MKQQLRQIVLEERGVLPQETWKTMSQGLQSQIFSSKWYQDAPRVFTFVSMGKEVDTYALIERAWRDGKEVAVPIAKKKDEMYFVLIHSFNALEKSCFGVMEPNISRAEEVIPRAEDLFLVPGVVFDRQGNRYGYGGGFYDRYCEMYKGFLKVAVAFSFQVVEGALAIEPYDIPVDIIYSEHGIEGGART